MLIDNIYSREEKEYYRNLGKKLKKNTEVLFGTFEDNNFHVVNISISPVNKRVAIFRVELETISDNIVPEKNYHIMVELYDENDIMFYKKYTGIYQKRNFKGFDTFGVELFDEKNPLIRAKRAKAYLK